MVEILRVSSLGQHMAESEEQSGITRKFLKLDLSSLKEEQRQQHEKEQERQQLLQQQQQQQTTQLLQQSGDHGVHKSNFLEPRRAFSTTDQPSRSGTPTSFSNHGTPQRLASPLPTPKETHDMADSYFQVPGRSSLATIPASPGLGRHPVFPASQLPPRENLRTAFGRPILPGPQRSYSVMDYEPVPFTHQPGTALLLVHLPPELHYAIFDFLDPIDSTAFGLTSKHFYIIHRQMHNKVSLAARRAGPNDMEWVWRNAGPFIGGAGGRYGSTRHNALAELSPRGQVYCRKCRTSRCELHNHIREFFPAGTEYCEVSQKFGAPSPPGAKPVCYRSSPRHPHRCGRHTRQQRAVRLT